jgi:hypothetical protein
MTTQLGWAFVIALSLSGCVTLHHISIGDIDNTQPDRTRRFEIEIEAAALNEEEIASAVSPWLYNSVAFFSMGPRTGNPRRNDSMGGSLLEQIYQRCPSGKVTGLTSRRETNALGYASIEVLRVSGYCIIEE